MRIPHLLTWIVMCCHLLALSVLADDNEEKYALYLQVMEQLEYLTPEDSIEVRVGIEKDVYLVGEPVEIRFMASEACYITLMDIGAASKDKLTGEMVYGPIAS